MNRVRGRRVTGALSLAVAVAVGVSGCSPQQHPSSAHPSAATGGNAAVEVAPTAELEVREAAAALEDVLDAVERDHDGVAGVSVATAHGVIGVGIDGNSRAWSTIKVPIAIAAMQQGVGSQAAVEAAISRSGNAEAAELWSALGGGEAAAAVVDRLLWRHNGAAHTRSTVDENPDEPTPIGWIPWALDGQAGFASRLACIPEADAVWEAMGDIAVWQRDGLGRIGGMHFKGGWSQEEGGRYSYTYRQFGALPTNDGLLGVAVIAHPGDGTHDTAAKMLDDLAAGVEKLVDDGLLLASDACVSSEPPVDGGDSDTVDTEESEPSDLD